MIDQNVIWVPAWIRLGTSPGFPRVLMSILVGILVGHVTRGSGYPYTQVFEDPGLNFGMVGTRRGYPWVYSGCNYLSNDANIIILDQKLTKLHENY